MPPRTASRFGPARPMLAWAAVALLLTSGCSEPTRGAASPSPTQDAAAPTDATPGTPAAAPTDPSDEFGANGPGGPANATRTSTVEPWSHVLARYDIDGVFVARRVGADTTMVSDVTRVNERVLPASTFKVLHSLIALDTGVLADVDEVVAWDGVERALPAWNQDHSLRTGIASSAVWLYQHVARQVGPDRMAERVAAAGYGNADVGGDVDSFWLDGALRVSGLDQLDLLESLARGGLPFEDADQHAVLGILPVTTHGDATMRAKTGSVLRGDDPTAWLVGIWEVDDQTWAFALRAELPADTTLDTLIDTATRGAVAAELLGELTFGS